MNSVEIAGITLIVKNGEIEVWVETDGRLTLVIAEPIGDAIYTYVTAKGIRNGYSQQT